ncbi:MAG TPA: phospholipase D family protein [Thermoanaerobaculia bacterium]|nr:phospholipase D family protein [Thermoanaerobaculia bacterium]
MRARKGLVVGIAILGLTFVLLRACSALPTLDGRGTSAAYTDTAATRLGRAVAPLTSPHPRLAGIHPVRDARDAFAVRYMLAGAAERTLDVQYYIWRNDMSGTLLFKALHDAANRGVRVRLLLDDNNTVGLDPTLAALDAHPKIEVRLFNPFVIRKPRLLGLLTHFSRLNRRMHNKSFTADNQVTVIGGRNVGDEYFGATDGVLFADLDVIAIGPVVHEVSQDFDRYWASDSSYPADRLLPPATADAIAGVASHASEVERNPAAVAYLDALRRSTFVQRLVRAELPLEWAATRMISDDPAKGLGREGEGDLLQQKLRAIFGTPATHLDLVSPYFVPATDGTALLSGWARNGVRLRVLTNSLEATDVAAVHAGYARRRRALLAAGVTLYELRSGSGIPSTKSVRATGSTGSSSGSTSSSGSSLHAKTFAVDRSRFFVGSFNFDPRSAELNTEMGFVIDSPALARQMQSLFDDGIPANAYEVRMTGDGELYWLERTAGATRRHDVEPGTTFWQRTAVGIMSRLPIEWLL